MLFENSFDFRLLVGSISAFIRMLVIHLSSTIKPALACRGSSSPIDQGF
ncbi:hypothetical protein SynRS9907_00988 [Synechococcus sp. RS9907]|nr:hypothetical protein SynRS9907_00988 [Synechococcus sp. RS9907]